MKKTTMLIAIVFLLSIPLNVSAKDDILVTNTTDSFMRHYLSETEIGVPSLGYYAQWSIYVTSADIPRWITVKFQFDSGNRSVKVYAIPYSTKYVDGVGYMKTFTNKVNVTIEII